MPEKQGSITHARRTYRRDAHASPDDSKRDTCDGEQTMTDEFSRLKLLLETMDVPDMRRDVAKPANVRWLLRNLAVNNSNNTALREVYKLLKDIGRVKK